MAINTKKLAERTNTFTFHYADESMEVEYRPSAVLTQDYVNELENIQDANESIKFQLDTLIVDWELVDEEGKKEEISLDLVTQIERPFWVMLFRAINEDIKTKIEAKKG
jgi:hypothetical protein